MVVRHSSFTSRQLMELAEIAIGSRSQDELWPEIVPRLQRLIGFDAGFIASTTGTAAAGQGVIVGHDEESLRANIGRYLSEISLAEVAAYTDRARRHDDVWGRGRRRQLSVFNEVMDPAGSRQIAVQVSHRQGILLGFNLERRSTTCAFKDRELALLDAVAPIVQMADALSRRTRQPEFSDWANDHGLTSREREVASLVTRGLRNSEIADLLGLSPFTVRNSLVNVFEKAQVSNRAELTFAASQAGQVIPHDPPHRRDPIRDPLVTFHENVRRAAGAGEPTGQLRPPPPGLIVTRPR
jgi:DNA-binding CsgD family transcriptional regulator